MRKPGAVLRKKPRRLPGIAIPGLITASGQMAQCGFIWFFTRDLPNPVTRRLYLRAASHFLLWCEARGMSLGEIDSDCIKDYFQRHKLPPSAFRQHLAAITGLIHSLVRTGVIATDARAFPDIGEIHANPTQVRRAWEEFFRS